jgi:UDP-N-acetylglucosamine transferase subunit ALG13
MMSCDGIQLVGETETDLIKWKQQEILITRGRKASIPWKGIRVVRFPSHDRIQNHQHIYVSLILEVI